MFQIEEAASSGLARRGLLGQAGLRVACTFPECFSDCGDASGTVRRSSSTEGAQECPSSRARAFLISSLPARATHRRHGPSFVFGTGVPLPP